MSITTMSGVLSGALPPQEFLKVGSTMEATGVRYSLFYTSGTPGAAVAPSPGIAGAALTTYSGPIPYTNPVSGNSYVARFSATPSVTGTLILYDRLWHNSGVAVTTTTAQTVNSATWPARDRNGATDGDNIMVGIEVSTATTNAGAVTNTTMSYTNSAGTSGRTATISSFPATAVAGTFVPFQLQAGDVGIRSIQSVTLGTSYGAGAIHLVAYRQLTRLGFSVANIEQSVGAIGSGFVRLYDNTVPALAWIPTATTALTVSGQLIVTQG